MAEDTPEMPELFGFLNAFTLNYTALAGKVPRNFHHSDYKCLYLLYRIDAWVTPRNLAILGAHSWRWIKACLSRLQYIDFCELITVDIPNRTGAAREHRARITPKGRAYVELIAETLRNDWQAQQLQLAAMRKGKAFTRKQVKNSKPVPVKSPKT